MMGKMMREKNRELRFNNLEKDTIIHLSLSCQDDILLMQRDNRRNYD